MQNPDPPPSVLTYRRSTSFLAKYKYVPVEPTVVVTKVHLRRVGASVVGKFTHGIDYCTFAWRVFSALCCIIVLYNNYLYCIGSR